MSQATQRVEFNLIDGPIVTLTGGSADTVLDVRGCTALVPWFSAGAHTAQPCDEDGAALPGSSADALAAGTKVEVLSAFYLIDVDASEDLTLARV